MRRRKEWFEKIEFYMALWWVEEGHMPGIEEAKNRLELLRQTGPSGLAFTFNNTFAAPVGEPVDVHRPTG